MANGSDREIVVDLIQYLIKNTIHIQDWPRVMVFRKANDDLLHQYCYKRFPDGDEKLLWNICNMENGCEDCKEILEEFKKRFSEDSPKIGEQYFHKLKLSEIFDHKILPSIEDSDIARYPNYFLFFEFPAATIFPKTTSGKSNGVKKLGDHYISKLTPIFDRLLMKRKILKHSVRAAVSAIISRNHSHHIGSHVTPRSSMEKIRERLTKLGYPPNQEQEFEIINRLKSHLDEYTQKKADFMAEIATEPLTTTIGKSLFGEVLSYFIRNSLLMDNIGANEDVNYRKKNGNYENRLKIHFSFKGKELSAKFKGSGTCTCSKVYSHINFPYTGFCQCGPPHELQLTDPVSEDPIIAWPGPLGEFAFYCFLENFIRNAVKHNYEKFAEKSRFLNIHISVTELDINDPKRDEFYVVEVWEDATDPFILLPVIIGEETATITLKKHLYRLVGESIVDNQARLKKGAWGIAEMKIMATLLGGSDDYTSMSRNLDVTCSKRKGDERLIYKFRLMKSKEVAVITNKTPEQLKLEEHREHGVWWFHSFKEFKERHAQGSTIATFNMLVLDKNVLEENVLDEESVGENLHLCPYRVLVINGSPTPEHAEFEEIPGAKEVEIDFNDLKERQPREIILFCWEHWVTEMLKGNGYNNSRINLFLQQRSNESPTKGWKAISKIWKGSEKPISFSIITENKTQYTFPKPVEGECHFFFDRHFKGYPKLLSHVKDKNKNVIKFHEAFDKTSADFVPIFSSVPSEELIFRLAEAASLKILIIDERVAEAAKDKIIQDEPYDASGLYGPNYKRLDVGKWGNIFIATHLVINNNAPIPIHDSVRNIIPRICVKCRTSHNAWGRIKEFGAYWCEKQTCSDCVVEQGIRPNALIIHQGVTESLLKNAIHCDKRETFVDALAAFLEELKTIVPYIAIDSGRGIPANLPGTSKFLPFSLVEDYLMKDRMAKVSLTRVIMSIIRRNEQ